VRNPRRERRRRIDPAELWEPLGWPLTHVKHETSGNKPGADAEWLAAHDDVADLFDGPHGRGRPSPESNPESRPDDAERRPDQPPR
jgi:hypothetical protein